MGRALRDGHFGEVRSLVGLVFQNPDDQLFSPTVFEDVAFGPLYMGLPKEEVQRRVEKALAEVGMSGQAGRMPHHLSLGERKRVAIATVLSMDPAILAVDEPSMGLDPRARRSLIRLLERLPQTIIACTHDMHLVRDLFPRTVVLDSGTDSRRRADKRDPSRRGVPGRARPGGPVGASSEKQGLCAATLDGSSRWQEPSVPPPPTSSPRRPRQAAAAGPRGWR